MYINILVSNKIYKLNIYNVNNKWDIAKDCYFGDL